ncbi:MAG: glycosyltransferase family 4 protein [Planctomycetes bacterium]|nr:glycosyltransferase family 4 protein [Planctomycetota bacterium]
MTPRRKRWYRPRNLAIGLGGAAALFIAYQVYWAAIAEPAPVIDYAAKLVELSESAQPAGENGWPLCIEAGGYVDEVLAAIQEMEFAPHDEDKEFYLDFSRVYGSQAIPPDIEPERLAVKMLRERGAFDLLAQAAACPRAVRPARGSPPLFMNIQLPELTQFLHLAKALTASMRLEAQQGNQVQRIAAFEHSLALGRAAASQWTLIDRLVGMSIVSMTLHELRYELLENAIDERFTQSSRREEQQLILERYQVNYPFLLYVGNVKPQKNIPRLIEAFAVIKGRLRNHPVYRDLRLVIIGDDLSAHSDLRRTVLRTRVQNDVRFLGFVPVETLRVFYQSAEVFVFPSLYEGFGLPPLEAMAQGTPVVTSNVSSLPEVVGDAAVLVHPENVFDIAHGIEQVLLQEGLRQELRSRGKRQLERFSWERSVERVLQIYAEAAEG